MKKLFILIALVLLSCPLQVVEYIEGEKGEDGKDAEGRDLITKEIYNNKCPTGWQEIILSEYINNKQYLSLEVFNPSESLLLCNDRLIFYFQVDFGDINYIIVDKKETVNFLVDKTNIIYWKATGNKIKVNLVY